MILFYLGHHIRGSYTMNRYRRVRLILRTILDGDFVLPYPSVSEPPSRTRFCISIPHRIILWLYPPIRPLYLSWDYDF